MRSEHKRDAARRAIVPALLVLAGIALVVAGSDLVGWVVFSVGLTLAIALVFLEIGYSEDRAREAEQRRR
jgi:uncharacterized membrane protein